MAVLLSSSLSLNCIANIKQRFKHIPRTRCLRGEMRASILITDSLFQDAHSCTGHPMPRWPFLGPRMSVC